MTGGLVATSSPCWPAPLSARPLRSACGRSSSGPSTPPPTSPTSPATPARSAGPTLRSTPPWSPTAATTTGDARPSASPRRTSAPGAPTPIPTTTTGEPSPASAGPSASPLHDHAPPAGPVLVVPNAVAVHGLKLSSCICVYKHRRIPNGIHCIDSLHYGQVNLSTFPCGALVDALASRPPSLRTQPVPQRRHNDEGRCCDRGTKPGWDAQGDPAEPGGPGRWNPVLGRARE